jgi:hypothetical protein
MNLRQKILNLVKGTKRSAIKLNALYLSQIKVGNSKVIKQRLCFSPVVYSSLSLKSIKSSASRDEFCLFKTFN